ncbi:hypothetical protein DXG01_011451, partial [Tephrocybe rancida]
HTRNNNGAPRYVRAPPPPLPLDPDHLQQSAPTDPADARHYHRTHQVTTSCGTRYVQAPPTDLADARRCHSTCHVTTPRRTTTTATRGSLTREHTAPQPPPRHVTHHTTWKDRRPHHINAHGTTIMTTAPLPGHITCGTTDRWTQYCNPTPLLHHAKRLQRPPTKPRHITMRGTATTTTTTTRDSSTPPCCCHPATSPPHRERPNAGHDTMTVRHCQTLTG